MWHTYPGQRTLPPPPEVFKPLEGQSLLLIGKTSSNIRQASVTEPWATVLSLTQFGAARTAMIMDALIRMET